MAANIFGQRMHHDIGAQLERPAQVGRGNGAVDDQRHAIAMGDLRQLADIGDIPGRVADRFTKNRPGIPVDLPLDVLVVIVCHHAHIDALRGKVCANRLYVPP